MAAARPLLRACLTSYAVFPVPSLPILLFCILARCHLLFTLLPTCWIIDRVIIILPTVPVYMYFSVLP